MKIISLKAVVMTLLITLFTIGVSGCMFGEDKKRVPLYISSCKEYLENKYGEEFTYLEQYEHDSTTRSSAKWYFSSESFPDKKILITATLGREEGTVIYHDNYLSYYYEDQTFEALSEAVKEVYGDCRVTTPVNYKDVLPAEYSKNTSFSEYIGSTKSSVELNIYLSPEYSRDNKETKLRELYEKLCEKKFVCIIGVYYTNDADAYDRYNDESLLAENGWYSDYGELWMDDDGSIRFEEWE